MSKLALTVVAAGCAIALAGCVPESGFVEVRRKATLHKDDVVMINTTAVTGLSAKESAVVKQPAGTTTLALRRGERVEKLCEFQVSKNRLTTVTLTTTNALVRCTTQS